jgi:hypothetical protein
MLSSLLQAWPSCVAIQSLHLIGRIPLTTPTARLKIGPETSNIAVDAVRHPSACQTDPVFKETSPASHRSCISRSRVRICCSY